MNVQPTEEQTLLRDSVVKFCENEIPLEKVRELADNPEGLTPELWRKIAEQGWLGLMISEEDGGLGLGVTEQAIVCEEMGRMVMPGAYLSTVLAAHLLSTGGSASAKSQWLEKIAGGEARATLALLESDGQLAPSSVRCAAEKTGGGYKLTGEKSVVADLTAADLVIVAARTGEGDTDVCLFALDKNAAGVSTAENKLLDLTSRSGELTLDGVEVGEDAIVGEVDRGWETLEATLRVANVCIAAASIAGAEYIFKLTLAYVKERIQFGKVIGSFQAVKHPLVDVFALLESAKSAYHYAAWAVDAASEDVNTAVAVARRTACEAYRRTTLDCLQAHGGIGFTWEYDLHLYLKRAKHYEFYLGEPRDFDEVILAEALGI